MKKYSFWQLLDMLTTEPDNALVQLKGQDYIQQFVTLRDTRYISMEEEKRITENLFRLSGYTETMDGFWVKL